MMVALPLALVAVAVAVAGLAARRARFAQAVEAEGRALLAAARSPPATVRPDVGAFPPVVARYLGLSGALEHAPVAAVRIAHGGRFKPALDGRWSPVDGRQWLTADPPGFVWWGRVRIAPGVTVHGRDRCVDGTAEMKIRFLGAVPMGEARGPATDASALARLLGELLWMPTALAAPRHVTWTAGPDARSAWATLRAGGREARALFRFGGDGLPAACEAERARDLGGGRSALTPFRGEPSDFRRVDGLLVPHRMRAVWVVDGVDRPYAEFEVTSIVLDGRGARSGG